MEKYNCGIQIDLTDDPVEQSAYSVLCTGKKTKNTRCAVAFRDYIPVFSCLLHIKT